MNIVTVHNLKKYFGKGENQVKALDGIDLEIEKGKFTAIIEMCIRDRLDTVPLGCRELFRQGFTVAVHHLGR